MFKKFIIAIIVVVGVITYYSQKGHNVNNVFELATKGTIKSKEEKINIFDVGNCVITSGDKFSFIKIKEIDLDNKLYLFSDCRKYKGCLKEIEKTPIGEIDSKYGKQNLFECPPE